MASKQIHTDEVHAVRLLLEYYGYDSLSYFALHEKKRYFFSSTGMSFLAYTISRRVIIVSGDPIGPRTDLPTLLREFTYFAKGAKLSICFLGIHEDTVPLVRTLRHTVVYAGAEALVNLQTYDKSLLSKKVRRAEKHIKSHDIVSVFFKREDLPGIYMKQIRTISKSWLKEKGGRERGFSMTLGRVPGVFDKDCEFVLAVQKDKVLGYLTFVPAYASHILSLDESRRRLQCPNGLTEFLFLQAFDYFKAHAVPAVSLNFATFQQSDRTTLTPPQKQLQSIVYTILSSLYKTNKLYTFNEKFRPEWQRRYVSFEKRRRLPSYLLAIAETELNF